MKGPCYHQKSFTLEGQDRNVKVAVVGLLAVGIKLGGMYVQGKMGNIPPPIEIYPIWIYQMIGQPKTCAC